MYGCRSIISSYCGFPKPPWQGRLEHYGGNWQHGWHPPEHNIHPEAVVGWDGLSKLCKDEKHFFVARVDQKSYLEHHGYKKVVAIGMPIVYVEKPTISRISDSLLVMPSHSLDETSHSWSFSGFSKTLSEILPRYKFVAACIHPSCLKKGYWVKEFSELGIPIIEGATSGDKNALKRMAVLFSSFSEILGNAFGSHLVYAAFFGARPYLLGPWAETKESDLAKMKIYTNAPEAIRMLITAISEKSVKKYHPYLFDTNAEMPADWARHQLGEDNKRSPQEIRRILGWNFSNRLLVSIRHRWKNILNQNANR
jgi:hypothetical protein